MVLLLPLVSVLSSSLSRGDAGVTVTDTLPLVVVVDLGAGVLVLGAPVLVALVLVVLVLIPPALIAPALGLFDVLVLAGGTAP